MKKGEEEGGGEGEGRGRGVFFGKKEGIDLAFLSFIQENSSLSGLFFFVYYCCCCCCCCCLLI